MLDNFYYFRISKNSIDSKVIQGDSHNNARLWSATVALPLLLRYSVGGHFKKRAFLCLLKYLHFDPFKNVP